MKTIQPISIWDNGQNLQVSLLNTYAVNVSLGKSAVFYYSLMQQNEAGLQANQVREGNLTMTGEAYAKWEADSYAWDWVAEQLKLTITGDYVPPAPPQPEPLPEAEEVIADEEEIVGE